MTNYKEILRLHSLEINNTRIAESCGCARSTVISTLQRADTLGIKWSNIQGLSEQEVSKKLYERGNGVTEVTPLFPESADLPAFSAIFDFYCFTSTAPSAGLFLRESALSMQKTASASEV